MAKLRDYTLREIEKHLFEQFEQFDTPELADKFVRFYINNEPGSGATLRREQVRTDGRHVMVRHNVRGYVLVRMYEDLNTFYEMEGMHDKAKPLSGLPLPKVVS